MNARRAILFDVDGVLVHGYHAKPEQSQRWDEHLLDDLGIDPQEFSSKFIYGTFIQDVLPGNRALIEALDEVLPDLGYRGSSMVLVDYWLSHDSNLDKDLLNVVAQLAAQPEIDLYLATNQEHTRAFWLWNQMGLGRYFKDIFYAARFNAVKPDRAFFDAISAIIGPQSLPPLFFDDSESIVDAACEYGWDGVLYEQLDDVIAHPGIAPLLSTAPSTP